MTGITSYGAYIPFHRLSRAEIAKAWGKAAVPGEKAIANYDEDSLTMAVAAVRDCVKGTDTKRIDGLYFGSTTSPYKEKQAAALAATAVDLNREAFTVDFAGSLRSGTDAMRAAIDSVNGGSAKRVLVCAADTRIGHPGGDEEMSFGDGAAAVMVGNTEVIATIEGSYTLFDEITDVWRSDKDRYVRSWESRFAIEEGYSKIILEAVSAALKKCNLTPKDFSKAVLYAPVPRQLSAVASKLGFDLKTQVQDTFHNTVGNTGTASVLISLVASLEQAKAGDRILVASYGNGCDVFILKVTDEIERVRDKRATKKHLAAKRMLSSYEKYLRWRELIQVQPAARPQLPQPSPPALRRDTKGGLALYGVKCKVCGAIQYPAQRVCMVCHSKDNFEDYGFANRTGEIFSFSQDNLAESADPPTTSVVVDFSEGGRIMCDMTDYNPQEVKVGMKVEMTFRKLYYMGGIHSYWWKCRPIIF